MKSLTLEGRMRRGMKSQRGNRQAAVVMLVIGLSNVLRYVGHTGPWWKPALALVALIGFVSYGWRTQTEGRRMYDIYEERLREILESTFHAITFADRHEAAAFVAALGRQLHSPRDDLASWEDDVEISATTGADGTTLYLSEGAMKAFTTAFAAPPDSRPVIGRDLPAERVPLLIGDPAEPPGLEDVLRRLDGNSASSQRAGALSRET